MRWPCLQNDHKLFKIDDCIWWRWHKFFEIDEWNWLRSKDIDTLTWGPAAASLLLLSMLLVAAQIEEDSIINDDRRVKQEDVIIAVDYEKHTLTMACWWLWEQVTITEKSSMNSYVQNIFRQESGQRATPPSAARRAITQKTHNNVALKKLLLLL